MVRDNVTGLIWEVKTDDGSVHDKDNQYTWYDSNPATNGGGMREPRETDGTDTEDFIAALNAESFGGSSDWRLPTIKELGSIANLGTDNPAIDAAYFPNTVSSNYWSSTTNADHTGYAWHINFNNGDDSRYYKSLAYYVRAVRGGQARSLGHLVISSPAQSSTWNAGSTMPIRWDTSGISGNVKISVSSQGGEDGTFQTIIDSTPNNGSYDWTVNVAASVNCVLRVEPVSDTTKGTSQGLFSVEGSVILPPTAATQAATAVTANSATLAGTVNPNRESTTALFEWGTDTGYGNETTVLQSPLSGTTDQSVTAELTGLTSGQTYHYRVSATNSAGNTGGEDMTFTTPVKEIVRKAIIVAGSGPYDTNYMWDATKKCARYAYYALKDQGYTPETIYFLSGAGETDVDGDGIVDVDEDATNANLEYAVKTWAPGADNLFIYLIGHGRYGEFVMGEYEMLPAHDFDAWLDSAQGSIPDFVAVLYDDCRSGSFLPDLLPPAGKKRVLVASAGPDEQALFSAEGDSSFGFHFFVHLHNGAGFYESFKQAKKSVEATNDDEQNPLIEADGDGNGNEKEDRDIAGGIKVGLERAPASEIPRIQSVSAAQTLPEGVSEASVYVQNVEGEGITEVFALIKPPDYVSGSPDDPVVDLPKIQLSPLGNRYQGTYDGFTSAGAYNIAIFAKDENGSISVPKQTTVTVTGGGPCLNVASDFSIQVPCADYNGNPYGFSLGFYRHPDDPSGFYWNLIMSTLTTGEARIVSRLKQT